MANICRIELEMQLTRHSSAQKLANTLSEMAKDAGPCGLILGAPARGIQDVTIWMDGKKVFLRGEVRWGFTLRETAQLFQFISDLAPHVWRQDLSGLDPGFPYAGVSIWEKKDSDILTTYAKPDYLCGGINAIAHCYDKKLFDKVRWGDLEWSFAMQVIADDVYTETDWSPANPNDPFYEKEKFDD